MGGGSQTAGSDRAEPSDDDRNWVRIGVIATCIIAATGIGALLLNRNGTPSNEAADSAATANSVPSSNAAISTGDANSTPSNNAAVSVANAGCGNIVGNQGNAQVDCGNSSDGGSTLTDDELIAKNKDAFGSVPPEGAGPWPFVVLKDDGQGLLVRTNALASGESIGMIGHRQTAWVSCKIQDSGFNPDPAANAGALWFQIRWSSDVPGSDVRKSEPSGPVVGYAFGGYLFPNGQNGAVPECT